jgi:hypothetical protein
MNAPHIGLTNDDPGKCVLGTVPVEEDGSASFRVPAGVNMFFQALDAQGRAVQTMRSITFIQPGQRLACIGCHESRMSAPPQHRALALNREASKITPGPDGSWPFRFDKLVQPVLDKHCVLCHSPQGSNERAVAFDLTPDKAWNTLCNYGTPNLGDQIRAAYARSVSVEGETASRTSPLLAKLDAPEGHFDVKLDAESRERLITWLDALGQRLGSFDDRQERDLEALREQWRPLLNERPVAKIAKSE